MVVKLRPSHAKAALAAGGIAAFEGDQVLAGMPVRILAVTQIAGIALAVGPDSVET